MVEQHNDEWTERLEDKKDEWSDKLEHKKDEWAGKAKEAEGRASGDESREREGKLDQVKSDLEQAADKVKDAFRH